MPAKEDAALGAEGVFRFPFHSLPLSLFSPVLAGLCSLRSASNLALFSFYLLHFGLTLRSSRTRAHSGSLILEAYQLSNGNFYSLLLFLTSTHLFRLHQAQY